MRARGRRAARHAAPLEPRRRSSSRRAASRCGSPASAGLLAAREPVERGRRARFALGARRRARPPGWTSSTAARCRRRRLGPRGRLRRRSRSSTGATRDVVDERGEPFLDAASWPRTTSRRRSPAPGGGVVRRRRGALVQAVRERTVGEMVDAARAAAGERRSASTALAVDAAGVTHTIGGLRVDRLAPCGRAAAITHTMRRASTSTASRTAGTRAARAARSSSASPRPDVDAGGIVQVGGYASGSRSALVLGPIAAEAASLGAAARYAQRALVARERRGAELATAAAVPSSSISRRRPAGRRRARELVAGG